MYLRLCLLDVQVWVDFLPAVNHLRLPLMLVVNLEQDFVLL